MNPFEDLSFGSISEELIVAFAGLTAFVNIYLVYRVMLVRDDMTPRLKAIAERSKELRAGLSVSAKRRKQHEKSMGYVRWIVSRLNLLRSHQADKAARTLAKAGWRSRDALT